VALRLCPLLGVRELLLVRDKVEIPVEGIGVRGLSPWRDGLFAHLTTHLRYPLSLFLGRRLSRLVGEGDLVVSFLDEANWVNSVGKVFSGHRAILSVHNDRSGRVGAAVKKKISPFSAKVYSYADAVVAVSEGIRYVLVESGVAAEKVEVIHNPLDLARIAEMAKEPLDPSLQGLPFLLNVGRLERQKGQDHLIRVFRRLKDRFPDLRLSILGRGSLKDRLSALGEALGLRVYSWDRGPLSPDFDVYLLGYEENPFKHMARARAFVLSSYDEGFPNVLLEAMACGCPVISSDCPSGPREIVSPDSDPLRVAREVEASEFGILVPPPLLGASLFEEELFEACSAMLEDEGLREHYSAISRRRALDFDVEAVAERWRSLIERVLR